jgi:hypothetical protein
MLHRRAAGAWHPSILLSRAEGVFDAGAKTFRKVGGVWIADVPLSATVAPATLAVANINAAKTTAAATVTPANGAGPYNYAWSKVSGGNIAIDSPAAAATTFTATGLADGETRQAVFRCKVTDALGNVVNSDNVTVTLTRWSQPALTAPASVAGSGTSATGHADAVTAVATGGTAPLAFSWAKLSGGSISADTPGAAQTAFTASGLLDGETRSAVFRCTVTDAHGLTATADVTVTIQRLSVPQLSAPASTSLQINTASGTTAAVTATVSGGVAPYAFQWARLSGSTAITAGTPGSNTTSFTATGLTAGQTVSATFRCTVTDWFGNTATADVVVTVSRYAALSASVSDTTPTGSAASTTVQTNLVSCNASGGVSPYDYSWTRVSGSSAITATAPTSASTRFKSTTVPAGGSQSAVFKCTVTDDLGQVVSTSNCTVVLTNTTATGATFSPAAGTYSVGDNGANTNVSFTINCSQIANWDWTQTQILGAGGTVSVANNGNAASITFTLAAGLNPKSVRWNVTGTAGGVVKSWTITLSTSGTPSDPIDRGDLR